MKKRLLSLFITLTSLVCFSTSCSNTSYEYNTIGAISGTVLDVDSGDPIQGALITLSPGGFNTYTGYDGGFNFMDLEAKQYVLTAQKTGYASNRKTITTLAGETVVVSLVMRKE